MKFYKNLYVSEGLKKKKEQWIKKMEEGKYPFQAYLLVLSKSKEEQLEFYSATMLYQKKCFTTDIFIVGIAESYMDAVYLVEEITREVYEHTGNADLRSYLLEKQKLYEENNKTEG